MTTTFVFCDLVGSTALLTELGPVEGEELRKQTFVALREALEAHHGIEVKSTGDGLMATFASVSDGARGAVALQQGAARVARRRAGSGAAGMVALRVGISLGDASVEDGDYYGASVVEPARLCDAASSGEILVSDLVRALVGSRPELSFGEARSYELKGLGVVSATPLVWSEVAAASAVPAALRVEETAIFVGRAEELEVLGVAWKEAAVGARRAVLLGGEPGIGKTTLAARAAHHAHG
ncbi:MAG: adenylate/guanylate cyclase domain-containing protein, partial [Actinomycetota bacterium]|nr:adenylate/guanylate cyclase domain-containing protein [Actinomycetota bacterium]